MVPLHRTTVLILAALVWWLGPTPPPTTGTSERPAGPESSVRRVAIATAERSCGPTDWTAMSLPGARGSIAMDVASVDARATWVVGMHAGRATPRRPWAVRRTAGGWRSVETPRVGSDAGLVAVAATSATQAWSVGFRADGRDLRPVALRWSGGRWANVSPPWRSGGSAALTDVSIGHEVWAVGYRTGPAGPRPYALRWRSGAWRRHHPALGAGFGALTSTAAIRRSGTWAAGWVSVGTAIEPRVWRWQRDRWVRERLPDAPGTEAALTGLAVHGRDLWAVGYRVDGPLLRPIAFMRRASRWQVVEVSQVTSSMLPNSLEVAGDGRLALVGSARTAAGSTLAHAVLTATGGTVRLTRRPAGVSGDSHLRAVSRDGRRLVSVGWTDGRALVLRSCPRTVQSSVQGRVLMPRHQPREAAPVSRLAMAVELPSRASAVHAGAAPSGGPVTDDAVVRRVVFRDVAARKGLGMVTVTYGGTSLDVNGDGRDDLLISRHQDGDACSWHKAADSGQPRAARFRSGTATAVPQRTWTGMGRTRPTAPSAPPGA